MAGRAKCDDMVFYLCITPCNGINVQKAEPSIFGCALAANLLWDPVELYYGTVVRNTILDFSTS